MNFHILSWLTKAQRFSLLILLCGGLMLQAMQMVSQSHMSMTDAITPSDHMMHDGLGDHADMAHNTADPEDHTGVCNMMACQALSPLNALLPLSALTLLAVDKVTMDVAMVDGPFVSQLGKPPKQI